MLFDTTNLFSDGQAITADAVSTNVIDFGETDTPKYAANEITRDIGKGNMVAVRIQVTEDFATLTSLNVALQTDTVEGFASPTVLWESEAVPVADLVAGYVFRMEALPRGVERYLRLNYNVNGTNATAGKITAGLVFSSEQRDV